MHSLNKIFRTIWSDALGAWIAVSELVKSKGKRSASSLMQVLRIGGIDAASDDIHRHRFKPAAMFALCLLSFGAQANPMGGNVVNGSASFNTNGNTLTVTNTPGTIIHWQDFSIRQNEITRFNQQSASSAVLNRVVGGNTSQILGSLQSNGRVFLVNPNGVVFGAGATVDVAGLVATSLHLSDADFLAGRHRFTSDPNAQAVSNAGNLHAQQGGEIWLIAPDVENSGVITAPNGEILLAAGSSVELVNSLDPNLRVNITAPAGDATNVGQLVASAGRLGLFGTVVRNSGKVSADSATMQGGKVVFRSSQRSEVGGTVSAKGTTGGTIDVLGRNEVQIGSGATLDASGAIGGGTILVGGDRQGQNPDVVNAKTTYVDATASIKADATQNGDGGKVIVWADDATHAHGSISARGGANGGDGGFVETSAHYLDIAGIKVDASAQHGKAGEWLLDPLNVTIGSTQTVNSFITTAGGVFSPTASGSYVSTGTIQVALNNGTSVTITTANGGFAEAGNITVNASATISKTLGGNASLTLLAEGNIDFGTNTNFSSSSGLLNIVLRSDADANGTGTVTFAGTNTFSLAGGRVDLYYNPTAYATPSTFAPTLVGATLTPWMLVNDVNQLQAMNTNLSGNYALGTNIDATPTSGWNAGAGFIPLGDAITHFNGNFDGMNHTINGLTINRPTTDYVGLFGYAGTGSYLSNVILTNASITGQQYVGSLVGTLDFSTINNANVGGTVSGLNYVGGALGDSIYLGTVSNSVSSASVTATGSNVGGLAGRSQIYSTITNSIASGAVASVGSFNVGGLVGYSGFNSTISGSSSSGNVSGARYVGGLAGRNAGSITSSSSASVVTGAAASNSEIGGLVGYNVWAGYNLSGAAECSFSCLSYTYGNISGSFATGTVTGYSNVGGLVGYNNSGGSTIGGNSYSGATVTGTYNVGGLVGFNNGSVSSSYSTSVVNGSGTGSANIGGLVGNNEQGSISASYATGGAVNAATAADVGGLVGKNGLSSFSPATISSSWANISVVGGTNVGGLVGENVLGSTTANSFVSAGSVTATLQIGGLVGLNSNGTVSNSWYDINGVTLNGGALVTSYGLYGTQYATWYSGGSLTPLVIGNYFTQDASLNYQIGTTQNLQDMLAFSDNPAYSFILTANLDMTTVPGLYVPNFSGTSFQGAGFSISNLNVSVPTNAGIGLFGKVAAGSTVSNMVLSTASVTGGREVGVLVGRNEGAVLNSNATAVAVNGATTVGGLVGSNWNSVTNSYVSSGSVVVSGYNEGGLFGFNWNSGVVSNSHFNVDAVTTNGGNNVTAGGLYAQQFTDWISGSLLLPGIGAYLSADVNGNYLIANQTDLKNMLGFADDVNAYPFALTANIDLTSLPGYSVPLLKGDFDGKTFTISNHSLSLPNQNVGLFGAISLGSKVGNLALVNSTVSGNDQVGALAGWNMGFIDNVSLTGTSTITAAKGSLGGLVGLNGKTSASLLTVAGSFGGGVISNSFVTGGTVSGGLNSAYVGGLVGASEGGVIDLSHVSGTVVDGTNSVGGLVGRNQGGFRYIYQGGSQPSIEVKTGVVSNSYVSGGTVASNSASSPVGIGGLLGENLRGFVDNGQVLGATVTGGSATHVGGLVGYNLGAINSYWNGTAWIAKHQGVISGSFVSGGSVSSTGADVGGLVGFDFLGFVDLSYVDTVSVTGTANVGGLVGLDGGEGWGGGLGIISNSHALNTQVSGEFRVGGLVGAVSAPITYNSGDHFDAVINSYVDGGTVNAIAMTGVISGTGTPPQNGVGGLVGYSDRGNILGSYVANTLVDAGTAASNVGGLVGYQKGLSPATGTIPVSPQGNISGSYVSGGTVIGWHAVGGLVGSSNGQVSDSHVTGAGVSGTGAVGGLVGDSRMQILRSYVQNTTVGASVSSSTAADFGGLVGVNGGTISQSFVSGGIVGAASSASVSMRDVGGLAGWNLGVIDHSYVSGGSVRGFSNVGGMVGYNEGSINQSYVASGIVTAVSTYVGGVAGYNTAVGSLGNTYWDTISTGQASGIGMDVGGGAYVTNGAALTAAQMANMSSFAGWDIANTGNAGTIWRIYEGHTGPLLSFLLTPTSVTANNASKTYDGIAYSGGNGYATSVAGATLLGALGGSSQGAVNAGTYVIDAAGLYSDQFGYDITSYTNGTLTLNQATLTLNAVTDSKIYDGTTLSSGVVTVVGLALGDTVSGTSQSFASKNVLGANASTLAVDTGYVVNDGNGGANYTVVSNTATGTIGAATLTLNAVTDSKMYDGTTVSAGVVGIVGLFGADTVSGATQSFASPNVMGANGSTLNVDGSYTVNDGNGGLNYTVVTNTATGTITPAALTLLTMKADDASKTYGTTLVFNGTEYTVASGALVGTDTISSMTLSSAGATSTANVGTYAITANNAVFSVGSAANYTITYVDGTLTVTPKQLSISGSSAANRVYDGTTTAGVTAGTLVGLVGSDTLTVAASGTFIDKNIGIAKPVVVNYALADGAGLASNYTLPGSVLNADITPLDITLTAPSISKTYDGTTAYTLSAADQLSFTNALVMGDLVTVVDMTYADKNAGTNKTVNLNSVTINDGNGGANYNVTLAGNSTSSINPADLVVTALPGSKILSMPDPLLEYNVSGLFDPVASVVSGTLVRDTGELIGNYAINQGSVTLISSNYNLIFVPGVFSIQAPTVVQAITQASVSNGTAEGAATEEEKKKEEEQVLAEADAGNDQGSGLPDNLPVCR